MFHNDPVLSYMFHCFYLVYVICLFQIPTFPEYKGERWYMSCIKECYFDICNFFNSDLKSVCCGPLKSNKSRPRDKLLYTIYIYIYVCVCVVCVCVCVCVSVTVRLSVYIHIEQGTTYIYFGHETMHINTQSSYCPNIVPPDMNIVQC